MDDELKLMWRKVFMNPLQDIAVFTWMDGGEAWNIRPGI
jgi:hypothetical protein